MKDIVGATETIILIQNDQYDLVKEGKEAVDKFLADHLRMWKDEGVPAPVNEIQSIHAWWGMLKTHGEEETKKRMAARLILLQNAAEDLNARGPEAEAEAGIYDNRADLRPS